MSRNCSLSPRQLAEAYAVLCCMSFAVAVAFTLRGAWYVLGFAFAELAAVALAFILYARHATDREHILLVDDCLTVELTEVGEVRQFHLNPRWTRVELSTMPGALIALQESDTRVEVGRFVTEGKRREFARELRRALAAI